MAVKKVTPETNGADHANGNGLQDLKVTFGSSLAPPPARSISKRAWGFDVGTFWVPVITAAKVEHNPAVADVSDEAAGAYIVANRDKAGELRINSKGLYSRRIHPDIRRFVLCQQKAYEQAMLVKVGTVMDEQADAYKAQVEAQQRAGRPIVEQDEADIADYDAWVKAEAEFLAELKAKAKAETERLPVAAD